MNSIAKNINDIRKRIENTSNGKKVTLIAVTKTFSAECAKQAIDTGILDIAESKIQEALPKFEVLSNSLNGINKHFTFSTILYIYRITVLNFDLIQSLDSIDLAKDINRHAKDIGKVQKCLIELKVSTEATKSGASKEKVNEIYDYCVANCPNVLICGIMTIAPYFDDKELVRPYFKLAYNVFENIKKIKNDGNFNILSMGMSDDFEIAIQEGSNMVRVGTAIFGERNYDK